MSDPSVIYDEDEDGAILTPQKHRENQYIHAKRDDLVNRVKTARPD
jgi:hypothetical protein